MAADRPLMKSFHEVVCGETTLVLLDGILELTRRLRTLPRGASLKILLTSASVLTFDPAAGRAAGCDDFLPKPFRTADLVEKITALLALTWRSADSASRS